MDRIELSEIGIGCWSFGGGDYWGEQPDKLVGDIVSGALDRGMNFFDTAEMYNAGGSEEALGRALSGRRHDALIASKVWPNHAGRKDMVAACEASLKRLDTDYLDLYLLHWPVEAPDESAAAMAQLISQGKVRRGGISNHGPLQQAEILAAGMDVAVNQVMFNLLSRAVEHELLSVSMEKEIGLIGYMPLLQGLLTDKYGSLQGIPGNRLRTRHFSGEREGARHGTQGFESLVEETLGCLQSLVADFGIPLERAALAWCVSRPGVSSEIIGVRDLSQLEAAASAVELAEDTVFMDSLSEATAELKDALGTDIDLWESKENSRSC